MDNIGNILTGMDSEEKSFLKNAYNEEFAAYIEAVKSAIGPETQVEIVGGQDDLCRHCPYVELCEVGDYKKVLDIMRTKVPSEVEKLDRLEPSSADRGVLLWYPVEIGRIYTAKELANLVRDI